MGGVTIEEDYSQGEDITENDPIHDDELSDTQGSDNSSSDQEDENYTEQEITHYRNIEAIENAQRTGLEFSADGWIRGNSALAVYVRHGVLSCLDPSLSILGSRRFRKTRPTLLHLKSFR